MRLVLDVDAKMSKFTEHCFFLFSCQVLPGMILVIKQKQKQKHQQKQQHKTERIFF